MRQELYNPSGFYDSSYLKMKINTNDSFLDFSNISEVGKATFLHEYIHYLQDITTTNGLFNIVAEVDYIKIFNVKLQQEGINNLIVPFETTALDGNAHYNLQMRKIWVGGGDHKNYTGDYIVNTEEEVIDLENGRPPLSFKRVFIQWGNPEIGGAKYYFGSYCISECMAYEIEQVLYEDIIKPDPPQMPYQSARLLADKVYPDFTNNVENLIALCDVSLMYNDSGFVFYHILNMMYETGYYPPTPENIYEYVFREMKFRYDIIVNPIELFFFAGHLANLQLNEYFRSNIYKSNSIWIARTLSAAQNIRTQIPSFILDLIRGGDLKDNIIFKAIKLRLGTPLIVNNENQVYFENILNGLGYKLEPQYFWVFKEIKELITKNWNERNTLNLCGLKDFCDKSCDEQGVDRFTDIRCRNNPWDRSNDHNPQLCYFGATWKAWALQGKGLEQV